MIEIPISLFVAMIAAFIYVVWAAWMLGVAHGLRYRSAEFRAMGDKFTALAAKFDRLSADAAHRQSELDELTNKVREAISPIEL